VGRLRFSILLCLACGCEPSKVVGYGDVDPNVPTPAVYETIELTFEAREPSDNPFTQYLKFEFWQGLERYAVDGFYDGRDRDGDPVYKARFMTTQPGTWHYAWSIGDRSGAGRLFVEERRNPEVHGHVRVDKTTPTVLWHDDGSVHYWFGGKSFTANNYGPLSKQGQKNERRAGESSHDAYYTDEQVAAYLDLMKEHGLNGTRLKIALYPLEGDAVSWDLAWIRRAEGWLKMMQERHIYCQITLFDARSRAKGKWFEASEDPAAHVLDAWDSGRAKEKQNYIRYVVARLAGYWNVYFELVDRIDHAGSEVGDRFVAQAQESYLPWLIEYDPYDLAIGASEVPKARLMREIDIEFPRDPEGLPAPDSRRSIVLNEMVGGCLKDGEETPADADTTVRDPDLRHCYRSALWRAFVSGASGANAASWLDLSRPIDESVLAVMRDHRRLKSITLGLGTSLDQLVNDPGFVVANEQHQGTRAKLGELYVAYFSSEREGESIRVRLPPGRYGYRWLDPRDPDAGEAPPIPEPPKTIIVPPNPASLERPAYDDDLVLVVERLSDSNP